MLDCGLSGPADFEDLEARIKTILPETYQDCYEDVQPISMGSAGLQYDKEGKVAWNEIWGSFCDLAMAGGPPHKGTLLEPGTATSIDAEPEKYGQVVQEICRGITLVTGLKAGAAPVPGWVSVECEDNGMAEWLVRAIVMENISASRDGIVLNLPAGPRYRIEKEIKNVITAIAKTCHYWVEHMWLRQQHAITELFLEMAEEFPLIRPSLLPVEETEALRERISGAIKETTGLSRSSHRYPGWLGLECPGVRAAISMMRAMVASNVLARREETVLFLPVNPESDPDGKTVVRLLDRVYRYTEALGLIQAQ